MKILWVAVLIEERDESSAQTVLRRYEADEEGIEAFLAKYPRAHLFLDGFTRTFLSYCRVKGPDRTTGRRPGPYDEG